MPTKKNYKIPKKAEPKKNPKISNQLQPILSGTREGFMRDHLCGRLRSEEEAVFFLVQVLQILGATIIDYRSDFQGRPDSSVEKGKDIVMKYNSIVDTYIGIQVKFIPEFSHEISIREMQKFLPQMISTKSLCYSTARGQNIMMDKAYLMVFGDVREDAIQLFHSTNEDYGRKWKLWNLTTIIQELLCGIHWEKLRDVLWLREYQKWEKIRAQGLLNEVKPIIQPNTSYLLKVKIFDLSRVRFFIIN